MSVLKTLDTYGFFKTSLEITYVINPPILSTREPRLRDL